MGRPKRTSLLPGYECRVWCASPPPPSTPRGASGGVGTALGSQVGFNGGKSERGWRRELGGSGPLTPFFPYSSTLPSPHPERVPFFRASLAPHPFSPQPGSNNARISPESRLLYIVFSLVCGVVYLQQGCKRK
eukprot:Hpha_TRINITY_DN16167_c1_g2::TRINITY_DN16167_c1_g2_i2::g.5934::m.5934